MCFAVLAETAEQRSRLPDRPSAVRDRLGFDFRRVRRRRLVRLREIEIGVHRGFGRAMLTLGAPRRMRLALAVMPDALGLAMPRPLFMMAARMPSLRIEPFGQLDARDGAFEELFDLRQQLRL